MSTVTIVPAPTSELTVDERWAQWVAKGVLHDRRARRRAISIGIAAACGLAAWLTTALMLR